MCAVIWVLWEDSVKKCFHDGILLARVSIITLERVVKL